MTELHDVYIRSGDESHSLRAHACAVGAPVGGEYGGEPYCPLYVLGAIGAGSAVKAAAAMLNKDQRHLTTVRFLQMPEERKWWTNRTIHGHYSGVKVHYSRLAMDTWQMLAIAKDRNLVISEDDESLWQFLKGDVFTTPLLRSWLPEVVKQLRKQDHVKSLHAFGCQPCKIHIDQNKLDAIVSTLVGCGALAIGE